jgi:hypothetical protein
MGETLFAIPWYCVLDRAIRDADHEIQQLDQNSLLDPALSEHAESSASKYWPNIATIRESRIVARRRSVEVVVEDDGGALGTVDQNILDVTIPFAGDAESVRLAPPQSNTIHPSCEIDADVLTLQVPDDQNAKTAVAAFVRDVSRNLNALRAEEQQFKSLLHQAIRRGEKSMISPPKRGRRAS